MEENIMENIDCKYFGNLVSFLGNPVFSQFSDHTARRKEIRFGFELCSLITKSIKLRFE